MQYSAYQPVRIQVANFNLGTFRNSVLCILIFKSVLSTFLLKIKIYYTNIMLQYFYISLMYF